MPPWSKIGGHIVFVLYVILSLCPPLWNFNLANNFSPMSARTLIFHMSIPCDKTFPWVPINMLYPVTFIFDIVTLALEFDNFCTLKARALIPVFHMSIPKG